MNEASVPTRQWFRRCTNGADLCLEMAAEPGYVYVRGTTRPDVELVLTHDQWRGFLAGVRSGAFRR